MQNSRLLLAWYGLTIFISSAVLLVLEITAGRLIAPYVGVTIYSWTSIIGVILAGLSVGNWIGGVLADRGAGENTVGVILILSAIFSVLSLWVLVAIAPAIQGTELDLISASFLYVLGMFLLPAILLGIPTPLLTTLALSHDSRTGRIVGRMHALAALGSIVGTFVTGFVLIQYLGSRNIVIFSAVSLFVLALPFFRGSPRAVVAPALLAISAGWLTHNSEGFSNPCDHESHYFCLRVVDASEEAPFGNARALVLDHLLHGINHETDAAMLIAPYVHLMQELVDRQFAQDDNRQLSFYFAGGGSYTQPRAVQALLPDSLITVAELDPLVTRVVETEMYVDTSNMSVIHDDARVALWREKPGSYDVIITDAFHDIAIPYHLVTHEYIELAKSRMVADGVFVTNVVDIFPDPLMVKSLLKTLRESFNFVDIWLDEIPQQRQRMTYVIAASDVRHVTEDRLIAQYGFDRSWLRVTEPLTATGTSLAELPVFTDDYVPVERMISTLLTGREGL